MFEFGTVPLYMFQFCYAAIEYQKSVHAIVERAYSAASRLKSIWVMGKVGRYFRLTAFKVGASFNVFNDPDYFVKNVCHELGFIAMLNQPRQFASKSVEYLID